MSILPANLFSRTELQSLITRADELCKQTKNNEQQVLLLNISRALAAFDGYLSELPITTHPTSKALANGNNWSSSWVGSEIVTPGDKHNRFRFSYSQQMLRSPNGLAILTGRHKVILGEDDDGTEVVDTDYATIRLYVSRYITENESDLPEKFREAILDVFREDR